jgi:GT2 family glycosyltransferase
VSLVADLRARGYSDDEIVRVLMDNGSTEQDARALLAIADNREPAM